MAADKTSKRKRTSNADGAESGPERPSLRHHADPRSERRYEPTRSRAGTITLIGAAVGTLLAGAGTYGLESGREAFIAIINVLLTPLNALIARGLGVDTYALRLQSESHGQLPMAPYLLAAGAAIMIAVAVFGDLGAKIVRVGDAGVAVEKDGGEIDRIPWYDVSRVSLTASSLSIYSSGTFITIPRGAQEQAIARIVAELKERLPSVGKDISSAGLEKLDSAAGTIVSPEPPQAAGQRCKNSEKIIAFEKDARFCGRCGEIYHKDEVPRRCLTCDAPLRSKG